MIYNITELRKGATHSLKRLRSISDANSAIAFRHCPFGDAVSATGRPGDKQFGDRQSGDGMVRRWDDSAIGYLGNDVFGDGTFGDMLLFLTVLRS